MVGRVVAEISGEDVVAAVHDVVGSLVVVRRIEAGMVAVGVPGGDDVARHHRDREHEQGVERVVNEGPDEQREDDQPHPEEARLVARIAPRHAQRPLIASQCCDDGVLQLPHRRAVGPLPGRFVLRLVEVVHVVPNDMVEHPGIRGDPGVEGVGDLEEPVQDRLVEGAEMLVVMVPGADASLGPNHEHEPGGEHPHAPGLEKHEQVEERERDDTEDRKHVLTVAEDFHGSGLRVSG